MSEPGNKVGKSFNPTIKGKRVSEVSIQYSAVRTALAFQRTRLAADRTLMAAIRTSFSLMSFGFTIFQLFWHFKESHHQLSISTTAPRILGFSLVVLGIITQVFGIIYHVKFMDQIEVERNTMKEDGLFPPTDEFPVSATLILGVIVLAIGVMAIGTMVYQIIRLF